MTEQIKKTQLDETKTVSELFGMVKKLKEQIEKLEIEIDKIPNAVEAALNKKDVMGKDEIDMLMQKKLKASLASYPTKTEVDNKDRETFDRINGVLEDGLKQIQKAYELAMIPIVQKQFEHDTEIRQVSSASKRNHDDIESNERELTRLKSQQDILLKDIPEIKSLLKGKDQGSGLVGRVSDLEKEDKHLAQQVQSVKTFLHQVDEGHKNLNESIASVNSQLNWFKNIFRRGYQVVKLTSPFWAGVPGAHVLAELLRLLGG